MKIFLLLGIINGFVAVALGAFGAHGLEGKLSEKMLQTWEKAVQYQMFHTVVLLATGLLMPKITAGSIVSAGWFFFLLESSCFQEAYTSIQQLPSKLLQ